MVHVLADAISMEIKPEIRYALLYMQMHPPEQAILRPGSTTLSIHGLITALDFAFSDYKKTVPQKNGLFSTGKELWSKASRDSKT